MGKNIPTQREIELELAAEFGYKQCEKGNNIETAMINLREYIAPTEDTPDKGTITWYPVSEKPNNMKPYTPYGGFISPPLIITDGFSVANSQYICNAEGVFINWMGWNTIPFNPTHYAYVNYPKKH